MIISRKTLINDLLKANKDAVIRQLVQLNPNFSKLRNPLLRNLFSRMVDIESACKVAGCEVGTFLNAMQEIGFDVGDPEDDKHPTTVKQLTVLKTQVKILDVRPILSQKKDPLKVILQNIDELKDDECLKLIAPFEPVPLIHMLSSKGYAYEVVQEEGSVNTYFRKDPGGTKPKTTVSPTIPEPDQAEFSSLALRYEGRMRTIDVRDLDMPQPMIMILENLQELQGDEALFVYHKKLPVYLLPHLQDSGYEHVKQNTADGKMNLIIYKP